jgi:hypothetical protein
VRSAEDIAATVEKCLAYSLLSERPFQKAADFLMLLRADPTWDESDATLVQSRALADIMKRSNGKNYDWHFVELESRPLESVI